MTAPGGHDRADDSPRAVLEAAIDAVVEAYGAGAHQDEAVRARGEWWERTGKVFEDDELFEARTAAFLEWYALERPMDGAGVPPAALALRQARAAGEAARVDALAAWLASHRSLFSMEAQDDGRVRLVDVVAGGHFSVEERRRLHGVAPGDIVEARLVGHQGRVWFGRTFLYHPAGARESILGHVRRLRGQGRSRVDVVDWMGALRVRALRYRHVAPERVYEQGTSEQLGRRSGSA